MTVDEAIKEAERQIRQSMYLRECSAGVYETGLKIAYEKKSELLWCLVGEINKLQAETERLKAEKPVRCGECRYWREEHHNIGVCTYKSIYLDRCDKEYCSSGERRDAE